MSVKSNDGTFPPLHSTTEKFIVTKTRVLNQKPVMKFLPLFLLIAIQSLSQTADKDLKNPLIGYSNSPIQFDKLSVAVLDEASAAFYKMQDERIKSITSVPKGKHTFTNSFEVFDKIQAANNEWNGRYNVISFTSTDEALRKKAADENERLSTFSSNIFLNTDLYFALQNFASSPLSKKLLPDQKKYLDETLFAFEKNGTKLSGSARKEIAEINSQILKLETQFGNNISNSRDSLLLTGEDIKGISQDILKRWSQSNDKYIVYISQANYRDVMKYADHDSIRHIMYLHYMNRAYPANESVLDSMLYYRQLLATELGFKSFASYKLVDKMAANPQNVWNFLNDLVARLKPVIASNINDLRRIKQQLNPALPDTIYAWDQDYYANKLLEARYSVNMEELKQYFEMNNSIRGMFSLYEKVFGIQIKAVKDMPVWEDKVSAWELWMDGKKIGSFYLDMYSRPGKFTQNMTAPITFYHKISGKEILPVATLICNFPEGDASNPSLLTMDYLVIMFHEFGHLVHFLLSHPSIESQNLFLLKDDFGEAPSQLLENWVYEYDAVKTFAQHYKTGEILPDSLFDKVKTSEKLNTISRTVSLLYYSLIDFTFHDKYDSRKTKDLVGVSGNLNEFRQMPFADGSRLIYSSPLLQLWPAGFYGFLWSRVFARDIFSEFQKNSVLDTNTGIRYRKEILEKGATVDEMQMLRNFLRREPNSDAFMRSIDVQ